MWDANVGTTERVLDAAIAEGVPRIVYISTVNVFGNTKGAVVDETYRRDLAEGFLSCYDETKYRAHEAAEARIAQGAPIVIVMPSQVYGPHDHSLASEQLHAGLPRDAPLPRVQLARHRLGPRRRPRRGDPRRARPGAVGERYCLAGAATTRWASRSPSPRGSAAARRPAVELPTAPAPVRWRRSTTRSAACPGCPPTCARRSRRATA